MVAVVMKEILQAAQAEQGVVVMDEPLAAQALQMVRLIPAAVAVEIIQEQQVPAAPVLSSSKYPPLTLPHSLAA